MLVRSEKNPLAVFSFAARLCIVLAAATIIRDLFSFGGDATAESSQNILPFNPLAAFRIVYSVLFLYLYYRESAYAWHCIIVTEIMDYSAYRFMCYIEPSTPRHHTLLPFLWIAMFLLAVYLRAPYQRFLEARQNASPCLCPAMAEQIHQRHRARNRAALAKKLRAGFWHFPVALGIYGLMFPVCRQSLFSVTQHTRIIIARSLFVLLMIVVIRGLWVIVFSALYYLFAVVGMPKTNDPDPTSLDSR